MATKDSLPKPITAADDVKEAPHTVMILKRPYENVQDQYSMGKELGRGQYGVIRECKDKMTGVSFACKSISKTKLSGTREVEDVQREIKVMEVLRGHSAVIELHATYEDQKRVHLIMELCEGGELFERISQRHHYPEDEAALLTRTLISVVQHCQAHGLMHRDLKPENILLVNRKSHTQVKVVDYGLAAFVKPGGKLTTMAGSAYYIAPEVLNNNYGMEADMWSVGVILYILLCGLPPFWAEKEEGIFEAIKTGKVDVFSGGWESVSMDAKDLVLRMLTRDPQKRITPEKALAHRWIKQHCSNAADHLPGLPAKPVTADSRALAAKGGGGSSDRARRSSSNVSRTKTADTGALLAALADLQDGGGGGGGGGGERGGGRHRRTGSRGTDAGEDEEERKRHRDRDRDGGKGGKKQDDSVKEMFAAAKDALRGKEKDGGGGKEDKERLAKLLAKMEEVKAWEKDRTGGRPSSSASRSSRRGDDGDEKGGRERDGAGSSRFPRDSSTSSRSSNADRLSRYRSDAASMLGALEEEGGSRLRGSGSSSRRQMESPSGSGGSGRERSGGAGSGRSLQVLEESDAEGGGWTSARKEGESPGSGKDKKKGGDQEKGGADEAKGEEGGDEEGGRGKVTANGVAEEGEAGEGGGDAEGAGGEEGKTGDAVAEGGGGAGVPLRSPKRGGRDGEDGDDSALSRNKSVSASWLEAEEVKRGEGGGHERGDRDGRRDRGGRRGEDGGEFGGFGGGGRERGGGWDDDDRSDRSRERNRDRDRDRFRPSALLTMFRSAKRVLLPAARAAAGVARIHGSAAASAESASLAEAYKRVAPQLDVPSTPLTYLKERPAVSATIPEKLTLNLSLPHAMPYSAKEVDSVIIPATSGQMGVLPGHVASIAELKPGLLTVIEGTTETKLFVSSGFAFVHPNSVLDVAAVDAVPLDQIDGEEVKKGLAAAQAKVASATTDLEKAEAQISVDVHSALSAALGLEPMPSNSAHSRRQPRATAALLLPSLLAPLPPAMASRTLERIALVCFATYTAYSLLHRPQEPSPAVRGAITAAREATDAMASQVEERVPHMFHFLEDNLMIEWWDCDFKAWYYRPYRDIVEAKLGGTESG
ncbi:unnamed protein product [Closterium sp. Yama58-4]|nr:unnamed protein product [Closterium sp. Yama58-4]